MKTKICKTCKHEAQWHTDKYGCLWHPKGTRILESVCYCGKSKEDLD